MITSSGRKIITCRACKTAVGITFQGDEKLKTEGFCICHRCVKRGKHERGN